LTTNRNTQLDGWRAFAVLGIIWLHWSTPEWRGLIPFEIGLYFFLTLTGFLITRVLLRERAAGEASGGSWRLNAYREFQKRRMLRILLPCYSGMIFALILQAPDVQKHWFAYFGHWSNFHMAFLENWPSGTAHYWTLAIQMQFYLVWPLVIFLLPQRWLLGSFVFLILLAAIWRFLASQYFPEIHHNEAITITALDYFGVGAILALAMSRGMQPGDKRLAILSKIAFLGYVVLSVCNKTGHTIPVFSYLQQTLVSVAFAGLISQTLAGFTGVIEKILNHSVVQYIGRLSFGLYLFHNLVPLLLGYIIPWLWHPFFDGSWLAIRLLAFALTSWGVAHICWKYIENGNFYSLGKKTSSPK
jgi:peptidoglycan/LPS O-acetylase OafA/YrhL